jgi:hypothetical protein
MLEALMKFGDYRVDRFFRAEYTGEEFGFYICAQAGVAGSYCAEAKHQLYYGLALIHARGELSDLAGIYIDINDPANLQRPAYLELKQDIRAGHFRRVLLLEPASLLDCSQADEDLEELAKPIQGFELFTYQAGEPAVLPFREN